MKSMVKTRAAVAAAAATALIGIGAGLVLGQTGFNDVPDSDLRLDDINYAAAQGWFRGYPDGSFQPDRQITEEQLARVIRRAHPGLTRGGAAVFLRGGIDRLRAAGITTTTAAAATTTAAATPGGPGAGGPVDPNPPVVIEPTTTTTTAAGTATATTVNETGETTATTEAAPAESTTTTTTTATAESTTTTTTAETTTTTAAPSGPGANVPAGLSGRNLVRTGFETGWMSSNGQSGSLFWLEFAVRDYRFPEDALLSNWWDANGSARVTITGRDSNGQTIVRRRTITSNPSNFYEFEIESVQVTCNHNCTHESGTAMPAGTRTWAGQFGYTKPAPTTTTTTTATVTTAPAGPTLVYGKEDGWRNRRNITGSIVWWEFRNWGSTPQEATLTMSYGGSVPIEDDEPQPYWFASRTGAFSVTGASCNECSTVESSTMPAGIRTRLTSDGYTKSSG